MLFIFVWVDALRTGANSDEQLNIMLAQCLWGTELHTKGSDPHKDFVCSENNEQWPPGHMCLKQGGQSWHKNLTIDRP